MKLFENGVGRPSNEIKKKRKIFIASVIAAVAIVLSLGAMLLFGNGDTENLKGASNGNYYMNMSVKNSKVTTKGCNITIPIELYNSKRNEMKITSAKITYSGSDTALSSISLSKKLSGNTQYTQNATFNMRNFTSLTNKKFKVVVYFTVNGKEYYKYDLYNASDSVMNALKKCKTTTKATTKKKTTKATTKKKTTKTTTKKKNTVKTTKVTTTAKKTENGLYQIKAGRRDDGSLYVVTPSIYEKPGDATTAAGYYIISKIYENGKLKLTNKCKSYVFNDTYHRDTNVYAKENTTYQVVHEVYSDDKCKNYISTVKSEKFKTKQYTVKPEIHSYIGQKKGDDYGKMINIYKYTINPHVQRKHYVKFWAIEDGKQKSVSNCTLIKNYGEYSEYKLYQKPGTDLKLRVSVYSDSSCKKRVSYDDSKTNHEHEAIRLIIPTLEGDVGSSWSNFYTSKTKKYSLKWVYKGNRTLYYKIGEGDTSQIEESSCKKLKVSTSPLRISVNSKNPEKEIQYYLYSDSKCTEVADDIYPSELYLHYDVSKPTISKACYKDKNVSLVFEDDTQLKKYALISSSENCKNVKKSNEISMLYRDLDVKVSSTKNLKVCVWDHVGNVTSKTVTKCK